MKFVVDELPYYGEFCPFWEMCYDSGSETIFDPDSPFRGLIDEEGDLVCTPGFYFYDTDHHQFFFGGKNFLRSVRNFIDKNPKEVNEMASY